MTSATVACRSYSKTIGLSQKRIRKTTGTVWPRPMEFQTGARNTSSSICLEGLFSTSHQTARSSPFLCRANFWYIWSSRQKSGINLRVWSPGGHQMNEKPANGVVSLLHHSFERDITPIHTCGFVRGLRLLANNCSGQNKNRYVLWYLYFCTIMGFNGSVELDFMVPSHTKNVFNGVFGHIKRKLKVTDALTPAQMMNIISVSIDSTHSVAAVHVKWAHWKAFLELYFMIPSSFSITMNYAFRFDKRTRDELFARECSFSTHEKVFSIVRNGVVLDTIRRYDGLMFIEVQYEPVLTPLREVKSAQKETCHGYLMHNIIHAITL